MSSQMLIEFRVVPLGFTSRLSYSEIKKVIGSPAPYAPHMLNLNLRFQPKLDRMILMLDDKDAVDRSEPTWFPVD